MAKKYYWLKLKKDFFKDKKMKKLRKIAGGEIYTLIYLKLQLLSLDNEGVIEYEGIEETLAEELELELDEEKEHIEATLFLLEKWGLAENIDDNLLLPQAVNSIGSESSSAERVRKHRLKNDKQNLLQCNATVTKSNEHIEIEKDIKLDKEKDINNMFETFWETYNKKINRKKCESKFKKLPKKDIEKILNTVKQFVDSIKDKQFLPHPYTYLNQERWNDEGIKEVVEINGPTKTKDQEELEKWL